MKRCRTKAGELHLRHEGKDYLLVGKGLSLPYDMAESIRPHVNVVHEDDEVPEVPKDEEVPKDKDGEGEADLDESQTRSSRKNRKSEAATEKPADPPPE